MRARTRLLQARHSKDPEAIKQAKADAIKAGYSNDAVGAIGRTPPGRPYVGWGTSHNPGAPQTECTRPHRSDETSVLIFAHHLRTTWYGLTSFNALSNFDGAYGHEFGRDRAMPIGLLKVLRVAQLPDHLMPPLFASRMDDQVRHLYPAPLPPSVIKQPPPSPPPHRILFNTLLPS